MILPTKHVRSENSLVGIGAVLLQLLARQQTVTRLWKHAQAANPILTFPRFVLALDFLFAMGAVELEDGLLQRKQGRELPYRQNGLSHDPVCASQSNLVSRRHL